MPKHISDAQGAAIQASATTLIFDALGMVRVDPMAPNDAERACAASLVFAATFCAAEDVWGRKIAVEGMATATAVTMGMGADVGAFINRWRAALGVNIDFSTPAQRQARKARQDFFDMVASLETADEYDKRTGGQGMSGDDAIDSLSSLIENARLLSRESAEQVYRFDADAPGHAAPEGGEL